MPTNSLASIFPVLRRRALPTGDPSFRITGRLRRTTLVAQRWMAIAGQIFALLFVAFGLKYDFPLGACLAIVGLSMIFNLFLFLALPLDRRVGDMEAGLQLGFDLLQLAGLLWLTGGMTNPFAILFMAPVVTSATTLSRSVLTVLGCLATVLSFWLLFNSKPLPWGPTGGFTLPFQFRLGMWIALLVGMAFTSMYAWRAAMASRRMSEALAATEAVLAQEQKLAALGGMAAAAAHELGTPLATIQLTAKEMAREIEAQNPLREDVDLLVSQSQRCRDILRQLALRGDEDDLIHNQLSLEALLLEAIAPFEGLGAEIDVQVDGDGPPLQLTRQSELIYGIKNFVENAVGFAEDKVTIAGRWTKGQVHIDIKDDGPGFDPTVMDQLGEPYVSGREEGDRAGGLGLGFFIAKTLIERTGGRVKFRNHAKGGAAIYLRWAREKLEAKS